MASRTTNYGLYKPDSTDNFGDFLSEFNDNMDEIDEHLGGGGGGGGHTIVDPNGSNMPAESKLQFTGAVSVTNDSVNGKTVVNVTGGGGGNAENYSTVEQVIGTWVDSKPLYQISYPFTVSLASGQTATIATLVDYENIISLDGWINENNIFYGLNDISARIKVNASGQLQFTSASGSSWSGSGYITIKYTKTTDT